jgi:hypothetical protein
MDEVIDHITTTEQQRNADQNRNEERHNHSPFVVRAGRTTLIHKPSCAPFFGQQCQG